MNKQEVLQITDPVRFSFDEMRVFVTDESYTHQVEIPAEWVLDLPVEVGLKVANRWKASIFQIDYPQLNHLETSSAIANYFLVKSILQSKIAILSPMNDALIAEKRLPTELQEKAPKSSFSGLDPDYPLV